MFCITCGAKNQNEAVFCFKYGNRIVNKPQKPPPLENIKVANSPSDSPFTRETVLRLECQKCGTVWDLNAEEANKSATICDDCQSVILIPQLKSTWAALNSAASHAHQTVRKKGDRRTLFSHFGRVACLMSTLGILIGYVLIGSLCPAIAISLFQSYPWCISLPFIVPAIFRLQDIGNTSWWAGILLIPLFGQVLQIYLLFAPRGYGRR
jgi:hypothetical protein